MLLSVVKWARRFRLTSIKAGCGLQACLAPTRLVPGVELEAVGSSMRGPFIVAVDGTRMLLRRGTPHRMTR